MSLEHHTLQYLSQRAPQTLLYMALALTSVFLLSSPMTVFPIDRRQNSRLERCLAFPDSAFFDSLPMALPLVNLRLLLALNLNKIILELNVLYNK